MTTKKLENMDRAELEARNQDLMAQKESIREEQRAIHERFASLDAEEQVAGMTDAQRQALVQAVKSAGDIESAEASG